MQNSWTSSIRKTQRPPRHLCNLFIIVNEMRIYIIFYHTLTIQFVTNLISTHIGRPLCFIKKYYENQTFQYVTYDWTA
jgi:hypothetical protein